jgi:hypothetical protein
MWSSIPINRHTSKASCSGAAWSRRGRLGAWSVHYRLGEHDKLWARGCGVCSSPLGQPDQADRRVPGTLSAISRHAFLAPRDRLGPS